MDPTRGDSCVQTLQFICRRVSVRLPRLREAKARSNRGSSSRTYSGTREAIDMICEAECPRRPARFVFAALVVLAVGTCQENPPKREASVPSIQDAARFTEARSLRRRSPSRFDPSKLPILSKEQINALAIANFRSVYSNPNSCADACSDGKCKSTQHGWLCVVRCASHSDCFREEICLGAYLDSPSPWKILHYTGDSNVFVCYFDKHLEIMERSRRK